MSVIGVDHGSGDLRLHSCPSCGRHAWRRGGREVDRSELLDALRPERTAARRPAETVLEPAPAEPDRRTELQRLLAGFTVHGTTS